MKTARVIAEQLYFLVRASPTTKDKATIEKEVKTILGTTAAIKKELHKLIKASQDAEPQATTGACYFTEDGVLKCDDTQNQTACDARNPPGTFYPNDKCNLPVFEVLRDMKLGQGFASFVV